MQFIFYAFSGIFAYLNYNSSHTREEIINILITGLKRLEYRGYDSAGMNSNEPLKVSVSTCSM